MPIANYEHFQDKSFQLRIGGDIDRTLTSTIENTPRTGEGAFLMWKHWRIGSGPVSYEVSVNNNKISGPTISGDIAAKNFVTLHEVMNVSDIHQGKNTVRFRVTDGTGTLRIADVVLFYRCSLAAPSQPFAGFEGFQDKSFQLERNGNKTLPFELNTINNGPLTSGEGAFLMWKHWRIGSGPVSYEVSVNNNKISGPTISGDIAAKNFVTLHEVINVSDIHQGENKNTVTFSVTDGTGTLRIADVVLFYRDQIFPVP